MPIVNIYPNDPGHASDVPSIQRLETNDTISMVTATGYLNHAVESSLITISPTDVILVATSTVAGKAANQAGWYQVSFSGGNWSLISESLTPSQVVLLNPSADQTITAHNLIVEAGNVQAGSSGAAGEFISFPATASKGSFAFKAVANTGNTTTTLSNAAMGQATVVSIPDPGASTANVLLDHGVNTLATGASIVATKVNGTEASNSVTASGMAGLITTSSLTTAGAGSYAITWTNTFISATSVVLLTIAGGTNTTENITLKCIPGSGTAILTIYNNTAATSLNGSILISYLVM